MNIILFFLSLGIETLLETIITNLFITGSAGQSREATPPQRAPSGGRTLKIITKSTAVKPPHDQEGAPSTAF